MWSEKNLRLEEREEWHPSPRTMTLCRSEPQSPSSARQESECSLHGLVTVLWVRLLPYGEQAGVLITFSILLACKVSEEFQNFEIIIMMRILTIILMVTETLRVVDTMSGILRRIC